MSDSNMYNSIADIVESMNPARAAILLLSMGLDKLEKTKYEAESWEIDEVCTLIERIEGYIEEAK
ncbi:MAG: hypothetical protein NUV97_03125 [archaeon]|nr:hypothetical protein [archaeon]